MESRVRADSNEIPMVVDHQDQDFDEETEYNAIDAEDADDASANDDNDIYEDDSGSTVH